MKPLEAAQKVEYFFESPKNRFFEIIKREGAMVYIQGAHMGNPASNLVVSECGYKNPLFSRNEIIDKGKKSSRWS